jgi:hypothetical protein
VREVLLAQGDLLQLQRDVQERVLPRHLEDLVRGGLDDAGPGVVRLVDPVTEAHEAPLTLADALHEGRDVVHAPDLVQHAEHGLVGPAMERAVKGRHGAGQRRVGIRVGGPDHPHRGGGAVLLVVRVQDEEHVERPLEPGSMGYSFTPIR